MSYLLLLALLQLGSVAEAPPPSGFALDVVGQLDRIHAEELSLAKGEWQESATEDSDLRVLGLDPMDLQQPPASVILRFAARAAQVHLSGEPADVIAHAGQPFRCTGRIVSRAKPRPRISTVVLVACDSPRLMILAAARFSSAFVRDDRVDILGYLAGLQKGRVPSGEVLTAPALALFAITKAGRIARLQALQAAR